MPHMLWRGAVSFGLVHVPVRLFPATSSQSVGFDLLDRRTMDPIGYRKINKATGKEVGKEEIARGFEYEKGKYVLLSDAEIRAANPKSTQTIEILSFVEAHEISFLYLDTPYFLAPDRGGEKVYTLLREALKRSGRIGVANIVLHNKQHLAALVALGDALAVNTLRWPDEVRDTEDLDLPGAGLKQGGVTQRELDMAARLIDDMTTHFAPGDYRDTFHDDILALVGKKVKAGQSREVETPEPQEAAPSADILDLSELLKRSLSGRGASAKGAKSAGETGATGEAAHAKPRAARRKPAAR